MCIAYRAPAHITFDIASGLLPRGELQLQLPPRWEPVPLACLWCIVAATMLVIVVVVTGAGIDSMHVR